MNDGINYKTVNKPEEDFRLQYRRILTFFVKKWGSLKYF